MEYNELAKRCARLEADLAAKTKQFNDSVSKTRYWANLAERRLAVIRKARAAQSAFKKALKELEDIDSYT